MNDERQAGSALAPARENSDVNPLRATSRLTLVNAQPAAAFLDNDVCARQVPARGYRRGSGRFYRLMAQDCHWANFLLT
jgi:hypothetical protein